MEQATQDRTKKYRRVERNVRTMVIVTFNRECVTRSGKRFDIKGLTAEFLVYTYPGQAIEKKAYWMFKKFYGENTKDVVLKLRQ